VKGNTTSRHLSAPADIAHSSASPAPADIAASTASAPNHPAPTPPGPDQNLIENNDDWAETPNLQSSAQGPARAEPSDNGLLGEVSPQAAAAVPSMQDSGVRTLLGRT